MDRAILQGSSQRDASRERNRGLYVPLGRNEDTVDGCHGRDVESDKPHWSGVEVSYTACNSLNSPSLGIMDVSRLP